MRHGRWVLAAAVMLLAACGSETPEEGEDVADAAGADTSPLLVLSSGDAPAAEAPAAEAAGGGAAEPAAAAVTGGDPVVEIRAFGDWYRAVIIDETAIADPLDLEAIGRSVCEGLTPCRAALWYDATKAPTGLPVAADQLVEQVFAFGRSAEGSEQIQWDCDRFPELEADHSCLPKPLF